ncbi:uncharacterized protein DUF3304 [Enterobacter sp. BIGb0383]|uniref:DUF3304 domain-containing protein n=1 Tax=unclassified Enterobacter TaxID=2608935 RepID=UPI000F488948|nr:MULTISPECIES: DUF3304 domain-containing protein [unclassified Enterobacter]ROP61542.1 uncharacterized protein DUF3304 [Enterobacter sp. BIGb0383]ROS11703.1 uncharacterized protein DUF3304 [Enterobacter sp. BIGb0359]
MDLIKIKLVKLPSIILFFGASFLAGYGKAETWSGGDLRGVNHTSQPIPRFSVNGRSGPNIGSYGEGGGSCCISLPDKWRPDLRADVEWEVSTNYDRMAFPGYADWDKYEAWEKNLLEGIVKHRTTVDIPDYGDKKCGLTVHFLPCNQIKVTASCWTYGAAEYPIKEPREMEEPAICPHK